MDNSVRALTYTWSITQLNYNMVFGLVSPHIISLALPSSRKLNLFLFSAGDWILKNQTALSLIGIVSPAVKMSSGPLIPSSLLSEV